MASISGCWAVGLATGGAGVSAAAWVTVGGGGVSAGSEGETTWTGLQAASRQSRQPIRAMLDQFAFIIYQPITIRSLGALLRPSGLFKANYKPRRVSAGHPTFQTVPGSLSLRNSMG